MTSGTDSLRIIILTVILNLGIVTSINPVFSQSGDPDPATGNGTDRGWGLGFGVVSSPRPYIGADDEWFPVPLVQYGRGGFFIEGIRIGYRWGREGPWRLELFGMPQFAGFDSDDSPFLDGTEERRISLDGAATLAWNRRQVELALSAYSDLLGRNDGQRLRAKAGFPFQPGRWRLTPSVGAVWFDDDFVDHYAGVRPEEARPGRPGYEGSSTLNLEAGFEVMCFFGCRWIFLTGVDYQRFGSEITDSPVVEDDWILGGFAGLAFRL